jgi:phosphate transport system permease protein
VQGSVALVALALAIALPAALGGALWLAELRPHRRSTRVLRFLVECLAAVPSVIYGLFGYACFVVFLRLGISLLAGSLVLAAVMFPILLVSAHEAFAAIEPEVREAALALGVDQSCLVCRVLLRRAWPGILAGVVLAVGHAVGSAAPILFTATVYFREGGLGLGHPVMTLPTHLYFLVSEAVSLDQAFATALVLVLALLAFNVAALLLRRLGSHA